ncbi:MAG TPA: protein tyrosine phosphatase [Pseudorhodoplanes sp.]|nr:protein tyrosine phosphatase [Pseudorhodoplanes sp.]
MIHVCSLARLHDTVTDTGARHIVTLIKDVSLVRRPQCIPEPNHLLLDMDDISMPLDGYVLPGEEHVAKLVDFVTGWDRAAPLVVHCYAGISRSTAGAFIAACALNPKRDERMIARLIRDASPTAMPNLRLVALADNLLERKGRMIRAVDSLGPGVSAYEGVPFRLDLE